MDINEIWNKTLESVKLNINSIVSYNVHIKGTLPVSLIDSVFTISAPTSISKNIIEHRYKNLIESSLEISTGEKLTIKIIAGEEDIKEKQISTENTQQKVVEGIKKNFTFENFVIGSSNEYAYAASLKAAEEPGNIYNPLFIYGPSGLGKTHLMYAIGNKISEKNPSANILYVSGEKFTNDFITAVRENTTSEFRKYYRTADLLLLDDVQFLENKEATQEEFFHTFNELFNYGKQIVLTSDRKPDDIKTLSDRLKTRFMGGYIIDVSRPNYETRLAILQKKMLSFGQTVDEEVLEYIALNISTSIRELEGALLKIISMSQISKVPLTKEFAEEKLKSIIPTDRKLTASIIINKTAMYYSISESDIMSKIKTKEIAVPRQVAMYLCRKLLNMNDTNISKEFGKDRSTVSHNVEKIEKDIITNEELNSAIYNITKDIQSV